MILLRKPVKLIGAVACYNELSKGNLDRFLNNIKNVVDDIVFLDDGSTDGSYERLLEYTPNVIRNTKNAFMHEQFNTQLLLERALDLFPDLTHIMNLNIDGTFSPACFKDGEALLHKFCRDYSREWDMFTMREINLWRSSFWWRMDANWRWHKTERIYVKEKGLEILDKWHKGLHKLKLTSQIENTTCISQMKGFGDAVSVHWGFNSKKSVQEKFHRYMSLEPIKIPCPETFFITNVFNMIDEFNVQLAQIAPSWIDEDIRKTIVEFRRPRAVSYYSDILRYDESKAECYKNHFISKLGFHSEEEVYL